ncbi:MAG: hypothetical protein KDA81_21400, partial [Planctomycetaceae bacterium]|nr:hypothetical protein [Planctomycetaceae bacterium]
MTIRKFLQSLKTRSQTGRRRRKSELRLDGTTAVEVLEIRSLLTAYFVDDLSDGPVGPDMLADGKLTLREALYAANQDMQIGDAPAGTFTDVIRFDASLFEDGQQKTFEWTQSGGAPVSISGNVTILGPGSHLLSIRPESFNDFSLEVGSSGVSTVYGVELAQGRGVYNQGQLDFYDVEVTQSSWHGIVNSGTMGLHDSEVRSNSQTGIENYGDLSVRNSAIVGNGVYGLRQAGAASADLSNVTVSGNENIGIVHQEGDFSLAHVTVTGNLAGLEVSSQISMFNTLIAGNNSSDYGLRFGSFSPLNYNETSNDASDSGVDAGVLGLGENGIRGKVGVVGDVGDRIDVIEFTVPEGLVVTEIPIQITGFDKPSGFDTYNRSISIDGTLSTGVTGNGEFSLTLPKPLGPGLHTLEVSLLGDQNGVSGNGTTDFNYRVGLNTELLPSDALANFGNLIGHPNDPSGEGRAVALWAEHGINGNLVGDGRGSMLPTEDILHVVPSKFYGTTVHTLTPGSPAIDGGMPHYEPLVAVHGATTQFRFEETSGTVAQDQGPLGGFNNGTFQGGAIPDVLGPSENLGRALQLDGIIDKVTATIPVTPSFTAEAWARSNSSVWNNFGWIASSRVANGFLIHPVKDSNEWTGLVVDANGNRQQIGIVAVPDPENWHHYAISFDQETRVGRMYLDGNVVAETVLSLTRSEALINVNIGFDDSLSDPRYGRGAVDEFAYYDSALTPAQMLQHYTAALAPTTDQRGIPFRRAVFTQDPSDRRFGMPDIGAFEHQYTPPFELVVSTDVDE